MAAELKLSLSLIHQWSRGRNGKSEAANPLERVNEIRKLTRSRLPLDWLCAQAGGRFVTAEELPVLARESWAQMKAEMEEILRSEKPGRCPSRRRCRHRLADGRCGLMMR